MYVYSDVREMVPRTSNGEGAKKQDGSSFLLNGRQAETPAIVRAAIGNIQLTKKKPYKRGNEFAKYLHAFQQADEDDKFLCPSQDTDRLWASSVDTTAPPAPMYDHAANPDRLI